MADEKMYWASRPLWARYGVALACVLLGWLIREALLPAIRPGTMPFLFFFPAAALAAWYGGFGPGALATVLGAVVADWFFLEPERSLRIGNRAEILAEFAFVGS